ncbi:hemagglutinin/amebocyte aggregation factor-like [Nematostella vectensis]|uniref:hemagglutinin/amebocyte aggregation factor-like n=1 Tax=Nematostella vectensis TaxID=45351 RepID=UPI0020771BF3|nr:hemagglutinin/amebocyte aggregation factor-like [Nematostella vectensis]
MRTKCFIALLLVAMIVVDHVTEARAWLWDRRRRSSRRRHYVCHPPSTSGGGWVNYFDGRAYFSCPWGQSVSNIQGLYSACHRDRVWKYQCTNNPATRGRCSWSHWVNDFDQLINYHCPYSGFITGVDSHHSNPHEDRRFRFKCCHRHHYKRVHCTTTHYRNSWRGYINYSVPSGYYLSGVTSVHDNGQEDRRWQYEFCQIRKYHGK